MLDEAVGKAEALHRCSDPLGGKQLAHRAAEAAGCDSVLDGDHCTMPRREPGDVRIDRFREPRVHDGRGHAACGELVGRLKRHRDHLADGDDCHVMALTHHRHAPDLQRLQWRGALAGCGAARVANRKGSAVLEGGGEETA